jgi:hypothetical protein
METSQNDSAARFDMAAQEHDEPDAVAWQMIEPGRYQPRRIKGSCVGRELG